MRYYPKIIKLGTKGISHAIVIPSKLVKMYNLDKETVLLLIEGQEDNVIFTLSKIMIK
jgi:hypothetical protein